MSEVKRYTFAGAAGLYVYQADYDAALSRIAALQLLLNTADQRNADMQSDLTKALALLESLAEYATDSASAVMRARALDARKLLAHQSAPAAKE
jgi:hypothetical protein